MGRRLVIVLSIPIVVVAAMAFLSPVTALNAIAWAVGGYRVQTDIAYAAGPRQRLDIYRPASGRSDSPVVVFFYGGAWEDGDKGMYRFAAASLASRGFTTVVPDYRVYPEVRFPDFLDDAARAVAFVHAKVSTGAPIVLMGHSAGAHIAAMLALDPAWLARYGLSPARDVTALVGLAGPYDFLPLHSATLKAIFGPPAQLAATQPINFVTATAPPAFLATGRTDTTVDPGNTERLAARIQSAGGTVETHMYDRLNHQTMIGALAAPLRPLAPVLDDVARFIAHGPADRTEPRSGHQPDVSIP